MTTESIHSIYDGLNRPHPGLITNPKEYFHHKTWLCTPSKRKNDLCIVGDESVDHRSNGIQTSIVISVLPQNCPDCGYTSEDPVISSRATAMLIISMYRRPTCPNCRVC